MAKKIFKKNSSIISVWFTLSTFIMLGWLYAIKAAIKRGGGSFSALKSGTWVIVGIITGFIFFLIIFPIRMMSFLQKPLTKKYALSKSQQKYLGLMQTLILIFWVWFIAGLNIYLFRGQAVRLPIYLWRPPLYCVFPLIAILLTLSFGIMAIKRNKG